MSGSSDLRAKNMTDIDNPPGREPGTGRSRRKVTPPDDDIWRAATRLSVRERTEITAMPSLNAHGRIGRRGCARLHLRFFAFAVEMAVFGRERMAIWRMLVRVEGNAGRRK